MDEEKARKKVLKQRLAGVAFGVFVIWIGVLWLFPEGRLPQSTWIVGAGVIVLGYNAARYFFGIGINRLSIVLGVIAILFGLTDYYTVKLPCVPAFLIVLGVLIVAKTLVSKGRGGEEEKH